MTDSIRYAECLVCEKERDVDKQTRLCAADAVWYEQRSRSRIAGSRFVPRADKLRETAVECAFARAG